MKVFKTRIIYIALLLPLLLYSGCIALLPAFLPNDNSYHNRSQSEIASEQLMNQRRALEREGDNLEKRFDENKELWEDFGKHADLFHRTTTKKQWLNIVALRQLHREGDLYGNKISDKYYNDIARKILPKRQYELMRREDTAFANMNAYTDRLLTDYERYKEEREDYNRMLPTMLQAIQMERMIEAQKRAANAAYWRDFQNRQQQQYNWNILHSEVQQLNNNLPRRDGYLRVIQGGY